MGTAVPQEKIDALIPEDGRKFTRKNTGGTTIVFYAIPNDGQLTELTAKENEKKKAYYLKEDTDFITPHTNTITATKYAMRQAESCGNIRFIDWNALTPEDKKALETNGITIPPSPDFYILEDKSPSFRMQGRAEFPRINDEDPASILRINYLCAYDNKPGQLESLVLHEFGHILGFEHVGNKDDMGRENAKNSAAGSGEKKLPSYEDTKQFSVMSYCFLPECIGATEIEINQQEQFRDLLLYQFSLFPIAFRPFDRAAIGYQYGKAENPDPEMRALFATEDQRMEKEYANFCINLAISIKIDNQFIPALKQTLIDYVNDGDLSEEDLKNLNKTAKKLKSDLFYTTEEKAAIQRLSRNTGDIAIIATEEGFAAIICGVSNKGFQHVNFKTLNPITLDKLKKSDEIIKAVVIDTMNAENLGNLSSPLQTTPPQKQPGKNHDNTPRH